MTGTTTALAPYPVRVIANPMAGRDEPFFGPLAAAFGEADVRWNIDVTNGPGEAAELARKAVAEGAHMVVAFGGDGTVSEVADAIAGTEAVLGILPGGTANVFAREMGVPTTLEDAAKLLAGPHDVRPADLGTVEFTDGTTRTFILRVSVGLEATMVENAPREEKERLGQLAYAIQALRELPTATVAHYSITADGDRTVELDGLFAVITNAASLGIGDAVYSPSIRVDDGLVEGIIAPAQPAGLAAVAAAALSKAETDAVECVSGRLVELVADPPQRVTVDGEPLGDTPVRVRVRPGAVRVAVPPGP